MQVSVLAVSNPKHRPQQTFHRQEMQEFNQQLGMKIHSLPVKEMKIVGLTKPYTTAEHDDRRIQNGAPMICEEDVGQEFYSFESCQEILFTKENESLYHEEARIEGSTLCVQVTKSAIKKKRANNKKSGTSKKLNKKSNKKKYGGQRGFEHEGATKGKEPPSRNQQKRENNSVVRNAKNRAMQPNKNGNGDDSESDHEGNDRHDVLTGHYAGIPQKEKECIEVGEHENSAQSSCVRDGTDTERPNIDLEPEGVSKNRILEDKKSKLTGNFLQWAKKVDRLCHHIAYKKNCGDCLEKKICSKVRECLTHFNKCIGCKICEFVDLGLYMHATECFEMDCPVMHCDYWRKWLKARHEKRDVKGQIIHSTTTLFKEGSFVSEDLDYTFLQKFKLGNGKFGDAWRVWFYSPTKQREADIVCKEVRYDPSNEAEIHKAIRQNHPNLLGAMAIVKFDAAKRFSAREKEIQGYVFMEKAECTLFDIKKAHVEKYGSGLPLRDGVYYFYQVLEGLRYLHDKGIVHKDIKDLNVLMFNNGQLAKISDWDASIFIRDEMELQRTEYSPRKGTPGFCAPEVFNQMQHGFPADVYSAAALFLEICFGGIYPTKKGEELAKLQKRKESALEKLKLADPELGSLIEKCLAENPKDRPTAYELVSSSCLKLEKNYSVTVHERQNSMDPIREPGEMRYIADIGGEGGDAVRQRFSDIQDKSTEEVLRIMDTLEKVLPSENLPQSSTWIEPQQVQEASAEGAVGGAVEVDEPMEISSSAESMEIS